MDILELYEENIGRLPPMFRPSQTELSFVRNAGESIERKLIVRDGSSFDKIDTGVSSYCFFDEVAEVWPGSSVIDLGCGRGKHGIYLVENHGVEKYVGIDKILQKVWLNKLIEEGHNPTETSSQLYENPTYMLNPQLYLVNADFLDINLMFNYDIGLNIGVDINGKSTLNHLDTMLGHVKDGGLFVFSGSIMNLPFNLKVLMKSPQIETVSEWWVMHENMANSGSNLVHIYQVCNVSR